ncbi:MAG: hypothetical protein AB8B57_17655 [Congregibacter sp.]
MGIRTIVTQELASIAQPSSNPASSSGTLQTICPTAIDRRRAYTTITEHAEITPASEQIDAESMEDSKL